MRKAKFPAEILVTRDSTSAATFSVQGVSKNPLKTEDLLEDGDAVAVYRLVHVYKYRSESYLEK